MESYRLKLENDSSGNEWLLEWDSETLSLRDPDGWPVCFISPLFCHQIINVHAMVVLGTISFASSFGAINFEKHPAALAALRDLVETGLKGDAESRAELRWQSLRIIACGLAMFVIGSGLFGLYCWFASWAPNPPPQNWIWWFGGLIHFVLLLVMGLAIAGPFVAYAGLRQWLWLRRIERLVAEAEWRA